MLFLLCEDRKQEAAGSDYKSCFRRFTVTRFMLKMRPTVKADGL